MSNRSRAGHRLILAPFRAEDVPIAFRPEGSSPVFAPLRCKNGDILRERLP